MQKSYLPDCSCHSMHICAGYELKCFFYLKCEFLQKLIFICINHASVKTPKINDSHVCKNKCFQASNFAKTFEPVFGNVKLQIKVLFFIQNRNS